MSNDASHPAVAAKKGLWLQPSTVFALAVIYYFSHPNPGRHYDYTFRIAESFLNGYLGPTTPPPPWLNEFVPLNGFYYSVFPLGSVLTMLPLAFLKSVGLIAEMPSAFIAALSASVICGLLLLISQQYELEAKRRLLMVLGILLGTWMWMNLTFGGAWQIALGSAMIGKLGAIYFTVYDRRPFVAGLFFTLAFGNRTEVLITAPVFLYMLVRTNKAEPGNATGFVRNEKRITENGHAADLEASRFQLSVFNRPFNWYPAAAAPGSDPFAPGRITLFCIVPFVLGVLTLIYNYARFESFTDFGYARIPGVLDEPWYEHGIFSLFYIPRQVWEMLFKPWEFYSSFPYIVPDGFSSSILWSSPFLLFAFRSGSRDRALKYASWAAVMALCFVFWTHGNSGGWQFGYRYAMVCLPWLFVILLETAPKKVPPFEWAAYIFSFFANAYATWLFHWTNYVRP